ncbi:acyl-CoA dehydrogenase family protein [Streptomyces fungicidicus]|uniref:acyl-CoA dehydrogenase family protein n=1 Tax=Streptomyces fungicidicus TaxID=68203 RepID=UPI0033C85883
MEHRTAPERAALLGEQVTDLAADIDSGRTDSAAAYKLVREADLLRLLVPRGEGGEGLSFLEYTLILELIGAADTPTALGLNMHYVAIGSLCESGDRPLTGAAREFRSWVFDQVVHHGRMFASATSEAGSGAKLQRLSTTYRRCDGGYVLSGRKSFVSLAGVADYFIVAARNADDDAEREISHFVVAGDDPGVRIEGVWPGNAMAGTSTASMVLDDVRVRRARLMMNVEGMSLFKLVQEPHWMTSGYTGAYLGLAAAVHGLIIESVARDPRRSTDPVVRHELGRLNAEMRAVRALVHAAAGAVGEQRGTVETAEAVHAAKYKVGELLADLVSAAVRICGTAALSRGRPLERRLREAAYCRVMPAKPDECLEYLGKAAIGLDMHDVRNFDW